MNFFPAISGQQSAYGKHVSPVASVLCDAQRKPRSRWWTTAEEAFLRSAYEHQTVSEISAQMGRSYWSVSKRANDLGLKRGHTATVQHGQPCKHGHGTLRYAHGKCVECARRKRRRP